MAETMIPEHSDLAWLAGLLEGEGYFGMGNNGANSVRLRVTCRMTDKDVLRKAQAMTGMGRFYKVNRDNGYYKAHWKDTWNWEINKKDHIYALIVALYPFMGKRRGVRILEMIETYKTMPGRWAS